MPACFVGSVSDLEALVKLVCEQMVVSYKMQGLPVPPWRTKQALLSKWSPNALAELAVKIQTVRRLSIDVTASVSAASAGVHTHDSLYNGARPAAVHACHAAVGSAPPLAGAASTGHAVQAFAATALQAGGPQQLTEEQLLAIMPPEMQQQLSYAYNEQPAAPAPPAQMLLRPLANMQPAIVSVTTTLPSGSLASSSAGTSAAAATSASVMASEPGQLAVLTNTLPAAAPAAAGCVVSVSSTPGAVGDVLALLEAADSLSCSASGTGTLKFTRKASAEWKNQRSNGRKMKGLLAAALKKPVGSRGNPAACGTGGAAHGASMVPLAGPHAGLVNDAGAPVQRSHTAGAAAGGSEPLIRRTHYRTSGEEPWRRITTVRWGAYAAQQAAQQAQVASASAVG